MAQETSEVQTSEIVTTTEVTAENVTATATASAIDWDAAPVYQETVVEDTTVLTESGAVATYAPRGRWEFTDAQRIIIGVLLWLNIIIFVLGALLITGRLSV